MELSQVITIRICTATLMKLSAAVNYYNRVNPEQPTSLAEVAGSIVHVHASAGELAAMHAVDHRRNALAYARQKAEKTPPNGNR